MHGASPVSLPLRPGDGIPLDAVETGSAEGGIKPRSIRKILA
jgi:hypothetical protein